MTAGPLARPGRTAVRITGDYYQWLVAWQACVTALYDKAERRPNPIVAIGVEVDGAGNLDDVVLYREHPPHTRMQVKYAVDSSSPIDTDYLTKPSAKGGPSILRKIADGWSEFTRDGAPVDVVLMTNRAPSAADALLAGRDARTGLLMPVAGEQTHLSARGRLRATWADISGLTEDRLLMLLRVLRFDTARDLTHVEDMTSLLMTINGLRGDHQHVRSGADWVAEQVQDGHRQLDLGMIEAAVVARTMRAEAARSVLSVATLKPDPLRAQAVHALDWVDRFDGADAFAKRRPLPPATWAQLQADIEQIPNHLAGARRIMLTGSLRQATAFTIGATLRMVTNVNLAVLQGDQVWTTDIDYTEPIAPTVTEHRLEQGDELAVAVAVATHVTDDVLAFLRRCQVPVDRLVVLQPPGGAKDNSVATPAAAVALAVGIRDQIRRAVKDPRRSTSSSPGPWAYRCCWATAGIVSRRPPCTKRSAGKLSTTPPSRSAPEPGRRAPPSTASRRVSTPRPSRPPVVTRSQPGGCADRVVRRIAQGQRRPNGRRRQNARTNRATMPNDAHG